MIKIFWVEDQSHWIDKFRPLLERTDFAPGAEGELAAAQHNRLEVFKFSEPAINRIQQTADDDAPHIAILDANLNGNDDGGFSVSKALLKKWPALPIVFLSEQVTDANDTEVAPSQPRGTRYHCGHGNDFEKSPRKISRND